MGVAERSPSTARELLQLRLGDAKLASAELPPLQLDTPHDGLQITFFQAYDENE